MGRTHATHRTMLPTYSDQATARKEFPHRGQWRRTCGTFITDIRAKIAGHNADKWPGISWMSNAHVGPARNFLHVRSTKLIAPDASERPDKPEETNRLQNARSRIQIHCVDANGRPRRTKEDRCGHAQSHA